MLCCPAAGCFSSGIKQPGSGAEVQKQVAALRLAEGIRMACHGTSHAIPQGSPAPCICTCERATRCWPAKDLSFCFCLLLTNVIASPSPVALWRACRLFQQRCVCQRWAAVDALDRSQLTAAHLHGAPQAAAPCPGGRGRAAGPQHDGCVGGLVDAGAGDWGGAVPPGQRGESGIA